MSKTMSWRRYGMGMGYRADDDGDELDVKRPLTGPTTLEERFKAFWKDQWQRKKSFHLEIWIVTAVALAAILWSSLLVCEDRSITDTNDYNRSCMNSCKALDGIWIEQSQYGCICSISGHKRVLKD